MVSALLPSSFLRALCGFVFQSPMISDLHFGLVTLSIQCLRSANESLLAFDPAATSHKLPQSMGSGSCKWCAAWLRFLLFILMLSSVEVSDRGDSRGFRCV